MTVLSLGPVAFEAFEVPARIGFGGHQRVVTHTLPGGARVIDTMGRDDAAITWSGAFSGPDATLRARLLDTLRSDGAVWTLAWDAFSYSVVIAEFQAQYERSNWIPYRVSCTVLADDAAALAQATVSIAGLVLGDLAAATAYPGVDADAAVTALGVPGSVGEAASVLALSQLNTGIAQSMTVAGAAMVSAGDVGSAAASAGALAQLAAARGFALRGPASSSRGAKPCGP